MSAGMADIIAASLASEEVRGNDVRCWPADEAAAYRNAGGFTEGRKAMRELQIAKLASRIAEELAKAGYGLLRTEPEFEGYDFGDPNPVRVPGSVVRAFAQTPDPLAAALADPEGHALVKAIHDRKAEA